MNKNLVYKRAFTGIGLRGLSLGLAVALVMSANVSASAQGRTFGGRGQGQSGGAAQGQFGGRGAGGMNGRGAFGRQSDPSMSSEMELLQRDDVRAHLFLNGRQKEQLDSLVQQGRADMQAQMQASRPNRASMRGLPADDRQAKMQEMRDQRQSAMQTLVGAQEAKAAAILTPAQSKRLRELDLQWRGPLALSDPKVAEKVSLTSDQSVKVKEQVGAYRKARQEAMRGQFAGMGGRGQRGAAGQPGSAAQAGQPGQAAIPPPSLDPQVMQARMAETQKTLDKLRKTAGARTLTLLTPAQQQTWKTLQGQPFTFRTIVN